MQTRPYVAMTEVLRNTLLARVSFYFFNQQNKFESLIYVDDIKYIISELKKLSLFEDAKLKQFMALDEQEKKDIQLIEQFCVYLVNVEPSILDLLSLMRESYREYLRYPIPTQSRNNIRKAPDVSGDAQESESKNNRKKRKILSTFDEFRFLLKCKPVKNAIKYLEENEEEILPEIPKLFEKHFDELKSVGKIVSEKLVHYPSVRQYILDNPTCFANLLKARDEAKRYDSLMGMAWKMISYLSKEENTLLFSRKNVVMFFPIIMDQFKTLRVNESEKTYGSVPVSLRKTLHELLIKGHDFLTLYDISNFTQLPIVGEQAEYARELRARQEFSRKEIALYEQVALLDLLYHTQGKGDALNFLPIILEYCCDNQPDIFLMDMPKDKKYEPSDKNNLYIYRSPKGQGLYTLQGVGHFLDVSFSEKDFNSTPNALMRCENKKIINDILTITSKRNHTHKPYTAEYWKKVASDPKTQAAMKKYRPFSQKSSLDAQKLDVQKFMGYFMSFFSIQNLGNAFIQEQLRNVVDEYGFRVEPMKRDGLCLLHAVSHHLNDQSKYSVRHLQKMLMDHFQEYFSDYAIAEEKGKFMGRVKNYQREWAGEVGDLAPFALARILNLNMVIISHDTTKEPIVIKRPNAKSTIYLGYEEGRHYEYLVKNPTVVQPRKNIDAVYQSAAFDSWANSAEVREEKKFSA